MKVSETSFEAGTASGTCRNRSKITWVREDGFLGAARSLMGTYFVVRGNSPLVIHMVEVTMKISLLRRLDRYHETVNRIQ